MQTHDRTHLERNFRFFAGMCEGQSPLYATLSSRVAEAPSVYSLASETERGQSPVNLLFAAVQYLLLEGRPHPLAEFYPSVGGRRSPEEAYPVFADFCRRFEDEIVSLVRTRRVQTNEVGRCGLLLPAFAMGSSEIDNVPLFLIDIGASLGLNLLFDRYHYDYGNDRTLGPTSAACIRTETRGEIAFPVPGAVPPVQDRVGIDMAPVDIDDAGSVHWIQSLIWADDVGRVDLFRAACTVAREVRPSVIEGDALSVLPQLLDEVPADALPCIFHSHSVYQMKKEWRARFTELLADLSRSRELLHVSLEWLGDDPGPQLHLTHLSHGQGRRRHLADCHHHGRWIRWLEGHGRK